MTKEQYLYLNLFNKPDVMYLGPDGFFTGDALKDDYNLQLRLVGINNGTYYCEDYLGNGDILELTIDKIKPILYPLSDLAKEIEHEGERFEPINEIVSHPLSYYDDKEDALISIHNYPDQMRWWTIKILIKWHFDIAGLIEKGDAIDVNTLTESPYK